MSNRTTPVFDKRIRQYVGGHAEINICGIWVTAETLEMLVDADGYGSIVNLDYDEPTEELLDAGLIRRTTGGSHCGTDKLRDLVCDEHGHLRDEFYDFEDAQVIPSPETDAKKTSTKEQQLATELAELKAAVAHAVKAADWEPGDAQRALQQLRDDLR